MDFLDPKKKRAHSIRLYVGYILMVIAICMVSLLLWFQAYGFTYDIQTGDINQNGLVFLDAHPEAAEVYINGVEKGMTDQRLILPADNYTAELRREGYRTWQRKFTLVGGKIERFVYPFLFPEQLVFYETGLYASTPPFATQSPDRRWLIVSQPAAPLTFTIVDLNTELASSVPLNIPLTLFNRSGAKHDIQLSEWSTDNRHLIVKHTHDTGFEFVLLDREVPTSSVNLSRVFAATPFTDMAMRDKRFDHYYLHNQTTQSLSTADLAGTATAPFLNGVLQFKPHGDNMLLYTTAVGADPGRVLVRVRDNDRTYTVRDFPADSVHLLDIARFENRWYIIAGAVKDQKVYVLRDPMTVLRQNAEAKLVPAATLRIENAQFASFSANARFVAVQAGAQFVVYDAETDRSHRYDSELEIAENQKATWMDGHRLTLVSRELTNVFDFDGTNKQTLSASYPAFQPYFNSGYSALYTLANSQIQGGRAALVRTELLVKPEGQ